MVERDSLQKQLDAHGAMLHTFYEWRHKIMTRFAISIAAVLLGLRWAYSPEASESDLSEATIRLALCSIGAAFSMAAAILDAVNQRIIKNSYNQGSKIERELEIDQRGLFQSLESLFRPAWMSYRLVLRVLYLTSATIFSAAAALIALG